MESLEKERQDKQRELADKDREKQLETGNEILELRQAEERNAAQNPGHEAAATGA